MVATMMKNKLFPQPEFGNNRTEKSALLSPPTQRRTFDEIHIDWQSAGFPSAVPSIARMPRRAQICEAEQSVIPLFAYIQSLSDSTLCQIARRTIHLYIVPLFVAALIFNNQFDWQHENDVRPTQRARMPTTTAASTATGESKWWKGGEKWKWEIVSLLCNRGFLLPNTSPHSVAPASCYRVSTPLSLAAACDKPTSNIGDDTASSWQWRGFMGAFINGTATLKFNLGAETEQWEHERKWGHNCLWHGRDHKRFALFSMWNLSSACKCCEDETFCCEKYFPKYSNRHFHISRVEFVLRVHRVAAATWFFFYFAHILLHAPAPSLLPAERRPVPKTLKKTIAFCMD